MEIDACEALQAAESETGLSDWGGDAFQQGLHVFTRETNADRNLLDNGREMLRAQIHAILVNRLKLYRDRDLYPEIARQRIEKPLIVIGLGRSGTTLLHGLLAQDPRARSPLQWECAELSPPPRAETYRTDPRIAVQRGFIDQIPIEFKRMHLIDAQLPEECDHLMRLGFHAAIFDATHRVPGYIDWFLRADNKAPFDLHRHTLQHMQAFCAREWWVLKSPAHLFHLPRLLETYPDARIVFTHRDPATTLPSLASVVAFIRSGSYAHIDAADLGREQAALWKIGIDRAMAFRADPAYKSRIFDLPYTTLAADPLAAAGAVYEHFDIPMTAPAETAMVRFLATQPQDKHGAHRYTLEEFGLDRNIIHKDFGDYIAAYL